MRRWSQALLGLLLCACTGNPRRDLLEYPSPQSRTEASKQLHEALAFHAAEIQRVSVEGDRLAWFVVDAAGREIERDLDLNSLTQIGSPEPVEGGWRLALDTKAGRLSFRFDEEEPARRAETALGWWIERDDR